MEKIRVAMIAPYPAGAVLSPDRIKPKYRNEHGAPWVRALCAALARRTDVELHVWVHSRAITATAEGSELGVPFTFVPKREPLRSDPYHLHLPARRALLPLINAFDADVVHGFGMESHCGLLAVSQHRPSVVFIQGILARLQPFVDLPAVYFALAKQLERYVARHASVLVAETNFARDWALEVAPQARVCIIPHALNPEFLQVRPDFGQRTLLSIGALDRRKGNDTVIRAFAKCAGPQDQLRLVGDGPDRAKLARLAADEGVGDRVTFAGHLDREDVLREMAGARALVLGSRMDTSPNVLTEAHAAGLPVLGTRTGGIPEMIHHEGDGLLVPVDDHNAMAEAMRCLLDDQARAQAMGSAGRSKVAQLNHPDRIAELHVELYRSIKAPSGGPAGQPLNRVVRSFWEREACGTSRSITGPHPEGSRAWFEQVERHRYRVEPMIPVVAQFEKHRGQKLLEVGVGAGTDHLQWARAGLDCHGVDLTDKAIETTRARLAMYGLHSHLQRVDAEDLPFPDSTFDVVYSWGVIHHSANPSQIIREIHRVLKKGGRFIGMMYGRRSLLALKFWIRYALLAGKPGRTLADVIWHHMESLGTKAYTPEELQAMLGSFSDIRVTPMLTRYDLGPGLMWLSAVLPRRWGWFLVFEVTK